MDSQSDSRNAFVVLGLPVQLSIPPGEIEAQWHELSKKYHPDSRESGDSEFAAEINRAYETLKHPGSRLRHWLELNEVEIPRNAVLDEGLMALFTEIGSVLTNADSFLEKKKLATTAISKALLAGDEVQVQMALQKQMAHLKSEIDTIEERFSDFDSDTEGALRALERLRFLEKWNGQCRDRLVAVLT